MVFPANNLSIILTKKLVSEWEATTAQSELILSNQADWNRFAVALNLLTPLETWDVYLSKIATLLVGQLSYSDIYRLQTFGTASITQFIRAQAYLRFCQVNLANPYMTQNQRTSIDLAQLAPVDVYREFPLVARASADTLLGLFRLLTAVKKPLGVKDPVMTDTLQHLDLQPISIYSGVSHFLPDIIQRTITAGLWWLQRTGQTAEFDRFFNQAKGYLFGEVDRHSVSGGHYWPRLAIWLVDHFERYVQFGMVMATFDQNPAGRIGGLEKHLVDLEPMLPWAGSGLQERRTQFIAALSELKLTRPLAYFRTIWPGINYDQGNYVFNYPLPGNYLRLDNEGHLHVAVPSARLLDPSLLPNATSSNALIAEWNLKDYPFVKHMHEMATAQS
ncbi:hypothetical protein BJ085DRAFT_28017 [Dimargaris cristalligena]|uniref:Uncharacterized protein n=1 Tax=Dimargaris cristalligena TaxID=215637 RepID=A0A4P9ZTD1_9FUNG|nr:hypothetical protein BJ085DRAFT_28017 [Dimargaris cristalligena]|eukprot:RKP36773.1 hypothetical protein BJ085DRAFT_28017 [Dimargaris cristalligena]